MTMELNDILDLLYKMSECDCCQFMGVKKLVSSNNSEMYEFTMDSDWGDGGRYYPRSFTLTRDPFSIGGFIQSSNFDDIAWDINHMYTETIERKEKASKRKAILDKLTDEEREILEIKY